MLGVGGHRPALFELLCRRVTDLASVRQANVDSVDRAINAVLTDPAIVAASQRVAARVAMMSPATESVRLIEAAFE